MRLVLITSRSFLVLSLYSFLITVFTQHHVTPCVALSLLLSFSRVFADLCRAFFPRYVIPSLDSFSHTFSLQRFLSYSIVFPSLFLSRLRGSKSRVLSLYYLFLLSLSQSLFSIMCFHVLHVLFFSRGSLLRVLSSLCDPILDSLSHIFSLQRTLSHTHYLLSFSHAYVNAVRTAMFVYVRVRPCVGPRTPV